MGGWTMVPVVLFNFYIVFTIVSIYSLPKIITLSLKVYKMYKITVVVFLFWDKVYNNNDNNVPHKKILSRNEIWSG